VACSLFEGQGGEYGQKAINREKIEEVIRLMYEAGLSNRAIAGAFISIFRIASMLTLFSLLGLMLISPF